MKTVQSLLLFFLLFAVNGYPHDAFPSGSGVETTTSETAQSSTRPEGLKTLNRDESTMEQHETEEAEEEVVPVPNPEPIFAQKAKVTSRNDSDCTTEMEQGSDGVPECETEVNDTITASETIQTSDAVLRSETNSLIESASESKTSASNNVIAINRVADPASESKTIGFPDPDLVSEISEANDAAATDQAPDATSGSKTISAQTTESQSIEDSSVATISEINQASEAAQGSDTTASPGPTPGSETSKDNNTATISEVDQVNKAPTTSDRDQATEEAPGFGTTGLYNLVPEAETSEADNPTTTNKPFDTTIRSETTTKTNDTPMDETHVVSRSLETSTSPDQVPESVTSEPNPAQTSSPPNVDTPSTSHCTEAGNFSVPTNCLVYITCTGNGTDLSLQEKECPERTAFSPVVQRCTRDISPCGETEPICLSAGSITDPTNSSAYYWCVPSLLGGFHKYHVQCATTEVYTDLIGLCWFQGPHIGPINYEPNDRDIVKADWKQLKKAIKAKAKEEKIRQKMEAKAKAHADKLSAKQRKKQKGTANVDNDVTIE